MKCSIGKFLRECTNEVTSKVENAFSDLHSRITHLSKIKAFGRSCDDKSSDDRQCRQPLIKELKSVLKSRQDGSNDCDLGKRMAVYFPNGDNPWEDKLNQKLNDSQRQGQSKIAKKQSSDSIELALGEVNRKRRFALPQINFPIEVDRKKQDFRDRSQTEEEKGVEAALIREMRGVLKTSRGEEEPEGPAAKKAKKEGKKVRFAEVVKVKTIGIKETTMKPMKSHDGPATDDE